MSKRDKDKVFIPLWRDRCKMLNDPRLSDAQVGKIIRAAIRYELDGTTPEPMDEVGLDVLCGVLISDIDLSHEARKKDSARKSAAARARWNSVDPDEDPNDNDIDLAATGFFTL